MAPPLPGSSSGNQSTASGEAQRSIPTPFLTKTYQIVDDPAIDDVISWNEDGSAFVVWNPTVFARDLLPKYFKHNNLSSFVRQLNTYGFRKVAPERWEFGNESFRRGEKRLLCEIQRKNVPMRQQVTAEVSPAGSIDEQVISNSPPLVIPSASVCSNNNGRVDLGEQNEQLRKENEQLNRELLSMKALCSNIFALMSDYANRHIRNSDGGGGISMETEDPYAQSPTRLFGFELGTKRKRDSGGSMHLDDPIEVDFKVKSESFDDGGVHQQVPWIRRCHRHEDKICNS